VMVARRMVLGSEMLEFRVRFMACLRDFAPVLDFTLEAVSTLLLAVYTRSILDANSD
jgi:hypothetical protein